MTPAEIKAECERIWRDEPIALAINMVGWRELSKRGNKQRWKTTRLSKIFYHVKARKYFIPVRKAR